MITQFLDTVDGIVWGIPLIVLIMGTGILLTCRLKVLQFRKLGKALKYMVHNEEGGTGEVTSFGALATALSATIGTGNIVGVATAVVAGGPGALFWMIIAACFGMATKYAEGLLAIKYRIKKEDGTFLGGPFYYIEKGMKEKTGHNWRWLGKLFALFGALAGALGIGTITQVNGIANAAHSFFDPNDAHMVNLFGGTYSISVVITAIVVAGLAALVIIGGIKRIASVTTVIVPFMAIAYVIVCLCIIFYHIADIPHAVGQIVVAAFSPSAVTGGVVGTMFIALQKGVARGIFSNEAGLGSAPIAAAAAQTNECVRQGLVTMTGTFIDTICICTMTGLTLMVSGAYETANQMNIAAGVLEGGDPAVDGAALTQMAFGMGLPWSASAGAFVVMTALAFFAFTTILGWDYYAERCFDYLTNGSKGAIQFYRWVYIFAVLIGPFLTLSQVWTIADIFNALMAAPNLVALVVLSGVIAMETKDFFRRLDSGEYHENLTFHVR